LSALSRQPVPKNEKLSKQMAASLG